MSNNPLSLFLDANVLYKARLRDLFTTAQAQGLANVHWSEEVEAEWVRNSINKSKEPARVKEVLESTVLPNLHESISGWKAPKSNTLDFPLFAGVDAKDLHVASSAHRLSMNLKPKQAVWLVTVNLKDFPKSSFANSLVKPASPGEVLDELYNSHVLEMVEIAEFCRNLNPQTVPTVSAYAAMLKSIGCVHLNKAFETSSTQGPT